MACVETDELVEAGVDRVLTQYRESPKLLHMIRTYMRKVEEVYSAICDLPSLFDLNTAVGDQLTLIGKRMGFPRCHCVCDVQPVFGFKCDGFATDRPIVGFCEGGSWSGCGEDGISEICITDDEMYRKLLISRSYQMQSRYSIADLTAALQTIYGSSARVMAARHGRVVLAPFRPLTSAETAILQIVPRVLPIAPGIVTRWHFGTFKVFGFGEGWGGFCEDWEPEGLALATENGDVLVTEDGEEISSGPLTRGADWLCQIDVKPYSC
ncbi:DUF2612 domain-containing protein [Rhizobium leguminosarum]|uniref:DUF2612 domain-containing protein n=1 Tax=Rhizobium leguminosarum TaxID=384 RepID=UPI001C98AF94|nr:DUF2612 domain-containing protein [Rhizobium leguminosarum]MBY5682633.1 DUF2612 domain-containing protein [Rhizobium leguminosarum]